MHSVMIIEPLREPDREAWEVLARGYKTFYRTPTADEAYDQTWQQLMQGKDFHGIGARSDGKLIGIAHYLFHPSFWNGKACYLQDLYVDETVRGLGAGRALIEEVASRAGEQGASRFYWLTQEDNAVARTLYDKVAAFNGFIRYEYPLNPQG
jgi:GNAT superfamily N-acetyltransferase